MSESNTGSKRGHQDLSRSFAEAVLRSPKKVKMVIRPMRLQPPAFKVINSHFPVADWTLILLAITPDYNHIM